MRKILLLSSSFSLLTACTLTQAANWQQYFQDDSVTAYVDIARNGHLPASNIKRSSLLINYDETDVRGTHSAIVSFVLDCSNKMVRIDHFTTYKQLDGQGERVQDDADPETGFKSLSDFSEGDRIHTLLCTSATGEE